MSSLLNTVKLGELKLGEIRRIIKCRKIKGFSGKAIVKVIANYSKLAPISQLWRFLINFGITFGENRRCLYEAKRI